MPASVLTDLALSLSRRPVSGVDPLHFLGAAAADVAGALDVAGAVFVVPATGWVRGSDELSTLVGEAQHRDGTGPLPTALRTLRPMHVPDLTRVGPPALAAIAAEAGFTGSVAVVLRAGGRVVAGLQLLGRPGRPVDAALVDALEPVLALLGARTADLLAAVRSAAAAPAARPPARHRPLRVVRSEAPASRPVAEFVPVPLIDAAPELVTEELSEIGTGVLPVQRRNEHQPPRHRRDG